MIGEASRRAAAEPAAEPAAEAVPVDGAAFRAALSRFASGVVVATALDRDGTPRGFTASAFCSLSLDPPMVLVCLGRKAQCHEAFMAADRMAISILAPGQDEVAQRFATRGAEKFAGGHMASGTGGVPVVRQAAAVLQGRLTERLPGGDHTILLMAVEEAELGDVPDAVLVHHDRQFWSLGRRSGNGQAR